MPTINGLAVKQPDGTLIGWQAECCYCGEQTRFGEVNHRYTFSGGCEHFSETRGPWNAITFEFDETDEERLDREHDQETNRRILQEVEERR